VTWYVNYRHVSYNNPIRCSNFSNLFWKEVRHVSDSSSSHRQEFFTVHTAVVCHTGYADSLRAGAYARYYRYYNKPTRCTNFSNLFWEEALHVSNSSSSHRQEFFTVHTAVVYVIQVMLTACEQEHMLDIIDIIINQLDALISQIYFGRKLYMFRTIPLPLLTMGRGIVRNM